MDPRRKGLFDAASGPFREAGVFAWRFARAKFRLDPVFFALLQRGMIPDRGTLLDLGCGRGLLLALIVAAAERFRGGEWPQGWPPPPLHLRLEGIEQCAGHVDAARRALRDRARVTLGDVRDVTFPPATVIVMLDVLLYLSEEEQGHVLAKAAAALEPGGLLLLREADAGQRFAFMVTYWSERALETARGRWRARLLYRTADEWSGLLETLGFAVRAEPMSAGTPFANVLFVAQRRDA